MIKLQKTAWLIGIYSNDIEYRVRRLGYKLTDFYPGAGSIKQEDETPDMIVFSEDRFTDPQDMERLRLIYPKTVMIRVPAAYQTENPSMQRPLKNLAYDAMLRLIINIQEREARWEN